MDLFFQRVIVNSTRWDNGVILLVIHPTRWKKVQWLVDFVTRWLCTQRVENNSSAYRLVDVVTVWPPIAESAAACAPFELAHPRHPFHELRGGKRTGTSRNHRITHHAQSVWANRSLECDAYTIFCGSTSALPGAICVMVIATSRSSADYTSTMYLVNHQFRQYLQLLYRFC